MNNGTVIFSFGSPWSFCELELTLDIMLHFIAVSANIFSSQIKVCSATAFLLENQGTTKEQVSPHTFCTAMLNRAALSSQKKNCIMRHKKKCILQNKPN